MIIRIKIALFIFIISVMFSCKNTVDNSDKDFLFHSTDTVFTKNKSVKIINAGSEKAGIQFNINNKIWFSENELINHIINSKNDSLPKLNHKISNTWHFVINNTYHYKDNKLGDLRGINPLIFINSISKGICSDRNALFCKILRIMDYKCRLVHLDGHIVSEVYFEKSWHMLDADYQTYFINKNNKISSVNEIENNIHELKQKVHNNGLSFMSAELLYAPENYYHFFETKENNKVIKLNDTNFGQSQLYLNLPANSSLTLPISAHKDIRGNSIGKLSIKGYYFGNLKIPFSFMIDSNAYYTNGLINKKTGLNKSGRYFIIGENIELLLLINPLFNLDSDTTIIKIKKDRNSEIITKISEFSSSNNYLSLRKKIITDLFNELLSQPENIDYYKNHVIKTKNKSDFIENVKIIYSMKYGHKMDKKTYEKLIFTTDLISHQKKPENIYKIIDQTNSLLLISTLIFYNEKEEIKQFINYSLRANI